MYYCFFGHPKSASTYFGGIMGRTAIELGRKYFYQQLALKRSEADIKKLQPDFIISQNSSYESVKQLDKPYRGFHIIRDPRDICVSSFFSYKKTHKIRDWKNLQTLRDSLMNKDFEQGFQEILDFNAEFFQHMSAWNFGDPDILEIKYEDFIMQPEKTLVEIFQFLNLVSVEEQNFSPAKADLNRLFNKIKMSQKLRFKQEALSYNRLKKIN